MSQASSAKRVNGRYRVGVLGCGGTSGHFFEGWRAWPDDAAVVALCDVVPDQMRRAKQKYGEVCGEAAEYIDYRRMLSEANLDIVCVCSFSDAHLEHTQACLEAGAHVMVEKPVGYDLEEARWLRYLAHKHADQKVQVTYSLRFYKAFMDLRALVGSGVLGEIVSGEISYSHGHRVPGQRRGREEADAGVPADEPNDDAPAVEALPVEAPSRRRRNPYEDNGGNYKRSSELVRATHPWDLARYLLGEVREVFSARAGCEMGLLWMESGALCHVMSGTVRQANVGYMQQQVACIHGRYGSAWLHREQVKPFRWLATYKTDGDIEPCPETSDLPESSHGSVIRTRNLLDAIEGKAELICSLEDGTRTTDLLHALWLSQRMQVKVPVLPANHSG